MDINLKQSNLQLLSRAEVAEILGIKVQTLNVWHCRQRFNIPCIKIGSRAMYLYSDIVRFVESRAVKNV